MIRLIFILFFTYNSLFAEDYVISYKPDSYKTVSVVDNTLWNTWLSKYVSKGLVNYKVGKQDIKIVTDYIHLMLSIDIDKLVNNDEKLAYYINLYNSIVVYGILSNISTIKSVQDNSFAFFKKKFVFKNNIISIDDLEKKYILKLFNEPLVHFALNCASISCPPLLEKSYTGNNLKTTLKNRAAIFITNENGFKLDNDKKILYYSDLFNWYKELGSSLDFYNRYSKNKIDSNLYKLQPLVYNWNLNQSR